MPISVKRPTMSWKYSTDRQGVSGGKQTNPFTGGPVHAAGFDARRRVTYPERDFHPPAAEVIDRHG
jgi:hypothetical protein